ncbi:unnamed protein product [Plutella xylostella]|uniref:(diamondback moth) hypothetical protein n=1 Tax=Plutella xylostella TaxID=51655 RepID=A0A8S4FT74_PLUXY|nr:unnamed protein product [Plutella xylostella]
MGWRSRKWVRDSPDIDELQLLLDKCWPHKMMLESSR